ncbi:O-antigen ligase family protein [Alicyclobacillus vulcanalis]|uniref:O-Antigen ligase n=1 Tax=Alicyclobacillus vulcanalis TaxID=252246 RepID=A0A1N7K451_9BACL|nr:O-antigen ligase family protein [Alicyclobacillus vulcanalis]SIS56375.1 O-Antigen ligase [Alicyclobacillus vulcanalis]
MSRSHPGSVRFSLEGRAAQGKRVALLAVYALGAFAIINQGLGVTFLAPLANVWGAFAILALAWAALVRRAYGIKPSEPPWARYAAWYVLYTLALVLADLKHPVLALNAWTVDVEYIFVGLLVPLALDPEDALKVFYGVIGMSMLMGVDGWFQFLIKVPIPTQWLDVGEHVRTRVFSVMKSPAEFGANLELTLPLMLGLAAVDADKRRRWVYVAGAAIGLGALFMTYDRGSWLGLFASAFLVSAAFAPRILPAWAGIAGLALCVPSLRHRVFDLFNTVYLVKSSAGGRMALWQQAFDVMSRNPLFGAGLGYYGGYVATSHSFSAFSDNYYAKVLGETGMLGLVLFMAMHAAIVRDIMHVVKRASGTSRLLALGGLTGLTAVLIHSFVENLFEYNYTASLYYLLAGLLMTWGRSLPEADGAPSPWPKARMSDA